MNAPLATETAKPGSLHRLVRRFWRWITRADDRLATRLVAMLSQEKLYKADCFDYLCWLNETEQQENVKGSHFLVMASDGTTCWGHSYADAVKVAMKHDKELYDAVQNLELPEVDESA